MIHVDMAHPLSFHIRPFLDGEWVHDAVGGLIPDHPGCARWGWLRRWRRPPCLGERAEFYTVEGMVSWEFVEGTPSEIVAEWMDSDP